MYKNKYFHDIYIHMDVNIMKIFLADMTQTQKLTEYTQKITHYSMQQKEGSLQKGEKLKKVGKKCSID